MRTRGEAGPPGPERDGRDQGADTRTGGPPGTSAPPSSRAPPGAAALPRGLVAPGGVAPRPRAGRFAGRQTPDLRARHGVTHAAVSAGRKLGLPRAAALGLGGEAEPPSFQALAPASPLPISSGAPNRLSHGAPQRANWGEKGEGGEGLGDPRDVARVTS